MKPQSLIGYKTESENTKLTTQMIYEKQNEAFLKEMERISKEKDSITKERIKRLKYLYRKKTKGTNINLHTINRSNPEDPNDGQFKRIKQYEHYICKKIGLVSLRRELNTKKAKEGDPTNKYSYLKTSVEENEEQELKDLINFFNDEDDGDKTRLSSRIFQALGRRYGLYIVMISLFFLFKTYKKIFKTVILIYFKINAFI